MNLNACKGMGKGKQVSAMRMVMILRGGGEGGATVMAGAAKKKGRMEPCALGKDKLQRTMWLTIRHRDAENEMTLKGIMENGQRIKYLRRCPGAELTNTWEKVERRVFRGERGRRGGGDSPHI